MAMAMDPLLVPLLPITLSTQDDPPTTGELLADRVIFAKDGDRSGGVDRALDLHRAGAWSARYGRFPPHRW
jgi:hypothetical protein